ncbi:MAG: type II secretion system F family protein [Thermoplasmatales archaeon]
MSKYSILGMIFGAISFSLALYFFLNLSTNYVLTFDFIVLGIILALAPYGIVGIIERRKVRGIESRLPDFLRDVAEASKFGKNLADSITSASEGQYGILGNEIRRIASQIRWGVSVDEALSQFASRSNSLFTVKLVSTVIESNRSGGNLSDVLNLIANTSKETQLLTREKYSQLRSYIIIIIISYVVFLLTVVVLDVQFFPKMAEQLVSGNTASTFYLLNLTSIPEIKNILTGVVIIQGVGSGLMSGVLGDGSYLSGILYAAILAASGYLVLLLIGGV